MNVLAAGMVTAVGLSAAASCAAIRAKVAGARELSIYHLGGSEVIGAAVPGVALDPAERLVDLLSRAIEDCLGQFENHLPETLPILVGLSEHGRAGGCAHPSRIIQDVQNRLGMRFDQKQSAVVPSGNVAGFHALDVARRLASPAFLVCAVDSLVNRSVLHELEQGWRLKTSENSDGVVPGEAAAAVLIATADRESAFGGISAMARILGLGFGRERAHVLSEEPILGLGLAQAAQRALGEAQLEMQDVDFRLSDAGGESYAFKEQALALARTLKVRKEELPIWHCAESVGDIGAASGVCQLVVATYAFAKGYAPGNRAICYTSSVSGDRAVAIIERADSSENSTRRRAS